MVLRDNIRSMNFVRSFFLFGLTESFLYILPTKQGLAIVSVIYDDSFGKNLKKRSKLPGF